MTEPRTTGGRMRILRRWGLLGVWACLAAGCVPSEPIDQAELDQAWTLSANPLPASALADVGSIPSRCRVVQTTDTAAAEASLLAAELALRQGAKELEVLFSPAQATQLADMLESLRKTLEELDELREQENAGQQRQWADGVAKQLVRVEVLVREAHGDLADPSAADVSADPVLQMAVAYLDREAHGGLLGDMNRQQVGQLRELISYITLRLGFAVIGREVPAGLSPAVAERMHAAESMTDLQRDLRDQLQASIAEAPRASGGLVSAVGGLIDAGPKTIQIMQSALRQWDRVEFLALELRMAGELAFAVVEVSVLPGQEVRLADVVVMQPTLLARGHGQVVVIPADPITGEHIVLFEPLSDDAGAILKFQGGLWGLAKLFAVPLDDAKLREVRVSRHAPTRGVAITHVAVLTEALDDDEDARRLMVVQDWSDRTLERTAFSVEPRSRLTNTVFSYLKPGRRYTYQREKTIED